MMRLCKTIEELRTQLQPLRGRKAIGLVPTMGALHQGHLALIEEAKRQSECVVVSIFVNPRQFGEGEDFAAYPRDLERDRELLEGVGVDYCFAPDDEEMWPADTETFVDNSRLGHVLLGALRPGHFCGVMSVVAKLFNIVQPAQAFFGEKDFQQLAIIRRMVKDLNFPVEIVGVPVVREEDGLAQSSRNALLSAEERRAASIIPQALTVAARAYAQGERRVCELVSKLHIILNHEPLCTVEAIDVRDLETLARVDVLVQPAILLLSVRLGVVRLIDHQFLVQEEKKHEQACSGIAH